MRKRILIIIVIAALLVSGYSLVKHFSGGGKSQDSRAQKETAQKVPEKQVDVIDAELYSDHCIVIDLARDKVIYKKAAKEQTRPASLAKMMTALVVIEHTKDFDKRLEIPHDVYASLHSSGIAVAGFEDGENPTVMDLLYGMLFKSGAECCLTLARDVAGSEDGFIKLMNEKAQSLGMRDTTFGNTVGLDNPPCYTTAADLGKLLKAGLKNETFRRIFAGYSYTLAPTNACDHERTITNAAIRRFGADRAGVIGGKLGNTGQAALCLATLAKIQGREYLCISTHALRTEERYNPHVDDARTIYKEIARQLSEGQ